MADTITSQGDVPEYLKTWTNTLLTNASTAAGTPYAGLGSYYQATGETPFAQFNPLQRQAATESESLGPSRYLDYGAGIMSDVANKASRYGQMGNFYNSPMAQTMGFNYLSAQAPSLQNYQMGPAERVQSERFGGAQAADYMSPYMQNVVDVQKQQAVQDYARSLPQLGASASRVGGLRGSRNSIVQAEGQRNLQNQLQGIQAAGTQQAYQQGMQQYNTDQAQRMQAALANQQAGLTTGQQNLNALLGIQSLGAQQGLQAQQLNQAANQQMQQMQANQLQNLNQFGLTNAANQAQYGLTGANLGLQGLQQQLTAGQQLGQLGQNQFNQQLSAIQNRANMGKDIYGTESDVAKARFADYQAMMNDPMNKAKFMSGIIGQIPIAGRQVTPGSSSAGDWAAAIGSVLTGIFGNRG